MSESHRFHKQIGRSLQTIISNLSGYDLLLDGACKKGSHNLPLFMAPYANKECHFCSVDGLILKDNKVKVILEVDESGRKPLKLFGKAFAPVGCSHYIYKKEVFPFAEKVYFIQIFFTQEFQNNKIMLQKWQNVGKRIQGLVEQQKSPTQFSYRLFLGDQADFREDGKPAQELASYLNQILKS